MKKSIAIALSLLMLLTMAAGCSKSDTGSGNSSTDSSASTQEVIKEPVKMIFWGAVPEENGPKEVCDNFNKLDPNVQVEYYRYVNDDAGNMKLDMALAAGEKIDMFISYTPDRRDKRIETGNTADITELCKKLDIDLIRDFGSGAADNIKDGKVYTIPTMKYMDFMIYNKDMFDAAGIPAPTENNTWDDWREFAKKLTKGESDSKVYGTMMPINEGPFVTYGVTKYPTRNYYVNDDGSASLWKTIPDIAQGYKFFKEMAEVDKTVMSYKDVVTTKMNTNTVLLTAFTNGKIASIISNSGAIRSIKDLNTYPHDFTTGFAPMPKVDKDQSKYYAPISTNDHIAVNENCSSKEEAVKFIKWYATEGYDPMIKNGRVPLYVKYDSDAAFKIMSSGAEKLLDGASLKATLFGNFTEFLAQGSTKAGVDIQTICKEESEAYFLGKNDIDKLLDNLQTRTDEALKNAK